jgi:hypothetical protein
VLSQPEVWDSSISDDEFMEESAVAVSQNGVVIRNKEHLAYYRIFM